MKTQLLLFDRLFVTVRNARGIETRLTLLTERLVGQGKLRRGLKVFQGEPLNLPIIREPAEDNRVTVQFRFLKSLVNLGGFR